MVQTIDFKYKSVMLIDDNAIDNLINQKMIEACSFSERITCFSGGLSALDFLKNIDKGGLSDELIPEIIFLDINMPYLDGFQFLEQFELLSELTKSKIKVLVLTSSLSQADMERAEQHPRILKFVNKPLLEDVLGAMQV